MKGSPVRVRASASERRRVEPALYGLAAIVLAGAVLRFATLSVQSCWIDEALTGWEVRRSLGSLVGGLPGIEASPPLYFVGAWVWAHVLGSGDAALRAFSALAGAAVVPVVYLAARELLSVRAGLLAAALAAANPGLVWYSQEARPYALVVLLSALGFLFFVRAIGAPDAARRALRLWAVCSALAVATHYFACFPAAVEAFLIVRAHRRTPVLSGSAWRASAAVAGVGALLLPLAVYQRVAGGGSDLGAIAADPLSSRLREAGSEVIFGAARPDYTFVAPIVEAVLALALALLLWRGTPRERRAAWLPLVVGGGAVVVATALDALGARYVDERDLLPALAPLLVAVAVALSIGRAGVAGSVLAGVLCLMSLLVWVKVTSDRSVQREDWRSAARALRSPIRDRAIVISPDLQNPRPVPRLVTLEGRYLPSVHPLEASGAVVAEIDVLDVRGAPGGAPSPCSEPPPDRPAPGFRLAGHSGNCNYDLFRFVAVHPVRVTPRQLNDERLLMGGTTVGFQAARRPPGGAPRRLDAPTPAVFGSHRDILARVAGGRGLAARRRSPPGPGGRAGQPVLMDEPGAAVAVAQRQAGAVAGRSH